MGRGFEGLLVTASVARAKARTSLKVPRPTVRSKEFIWWIFTTWYRWPRVIGSFARPRGLSQYILTNTDVYVMTEEPGRTGSEIIIITHFSCYVQWARQVSHCERWNSRGRRAMKPLGECFVFLISSLLFSLVMISCVERKLGEWTWYCSCETILRSF